MKSQLPVSKAKTAYGLLSEIAALAIEEPKRMRMSRWLNTSAKKDYGVEAPACGTVGCICGWGVVLAGTRAERRALNGFCVTGLQTGARLFGLTDDLASSLFTTDGIRTAQGTPSHAREVFHRIRRFQKKYRTQLLAKKV